MPLRLRVLYVGSTLVLLGLVTLCELAGCSSSVSCSGDSFGCECEAGSEPAEKRCDTQTFGGASCCADPEWPESGMCSCTAQYCLTDDVSCTCSSLGEGGIYGMTPVEQCPSGGICCQRSAECDCFYEETSACDEPGAVKVANCSRTNVTCSRGYPVRVDSCSDPAAGGS